MNNQQIDELDKILKKFKSNVNENNYDQCIKISHWISQQLNFNNLSENNYKLKKNHINKFHPCRPIYGEVYFIDFGVNVGFEFNDYHAALIILNDTGNIFGNNTIVLPITEFSNEKFDSKIHQRIYNKDFEYFINNGLDKNPSIVKISDIRAIDKARLNTKVGKVNDKFLKLINNKIRKMLNLD